jgi:hypothetical protein
MKMICAFKFIFDENVLAFLGLSTVLATLSHLGANFPLNFWSP